METKKIKSQALLAISLALIVGGIFYLESKKVTPISDSVDQDIDVEAIVVQEEKANEVLEKVMQESDNTLKQTTEERLAMKRKKYEPAKEISTPDGFINTEEINITDQIGKKIVLVDFWTYSCINCQRTFPYLNDWYEKYSDDGLVILGLHTPEFEFEKDYDNVKRAVDKWSLKYPVILDNDYSTWRAYKNRYWPRKYLIDIDGFIVYDHIGEGGYAVTEEKIVELINEKNKILGLKPIEIHERAPLTIDVVNVTEARSPEIYLGSSRLKVLANLPNNDCISRTCEYTYKAPVVLNSFQLDGRWNINEEEAVLEGESGSIFTKFRANKVNLVVANSEGLKAEIYLDGELIGKDKTGEHVKNGIVTFSDSDLYNLVDQNGEYSEHLLEIRFLDGGVEAFAFTFG